MILGRLQYGLTNIGILPKVKLKLTYSFCFFILFLFIYLFILVHLQTFQGNKIINLSTVNNNRILTNSRNKFIWSVSDKFYIHVRLSV